MGALQDGTGRFKSNEEKYRFFFDESSSLNTEVDEDGIIIDVNRAMTDSFGYSREEFIGMSVFDLVSPHQREDTGSLLKLSFTGANVGDATIEMTARDGSRRVIYYPITHSIFFRNEKGKASMLITAIDITPLRDAEETLKQRTDRFREIFESSQDGIIYTDGLGFFVATNRAFTGITGITADEIIGKHAMTVMQRFMHKNTPSTIGHLLKRLMSGKHVEPVTVDYQDRTIEIVMPAYSKDVSGITFVFRDITERKEYEGVLVLQRDLAVALGSITDLEAALNNIIDLILNITAIDTAGVYIHDPGHDRFELVASKGLGKAFIRDVKLYGPESPHYQMVMSGNPIFTHFRNITPLLGPDAREENLRAIASIPVKYDGRSIAAINVSSRTLDEFPPFTRRAIEAAAALTGGAIARTKAERRLRESEDTFHSLFSNMLDGAAYFRAMRSTDGVINDFVITDINDAFERITGLKRADVIGYKMSDMFPISADYQRRFMDMNRRVVETGEGEHYEHYSDKFQRWFAGSSFRPRENQLVVIIRDIHGRKETERRLRESEERVRAIFDSALDYIFIKDAERRYTHVNPILAQLFDRPAENIIGLTDFDLFERQEARGLSLDDELVLKGSVVENELELTFSGGHRMVFHVIKTPLRDKSGNFTGICGIARDITDRKRSETDLLESEERFRRLAQASREGVIILDDGVIIDCNETYERMFGYPREEIIGRNTLDFTAPESREIVAEAIRTHREGPYEGVGLRKDGTKINTEVSGEKMPFKGKTVRVAAIRDITARKMDEERIRASLEEKDVLLKEIHHRVKNNLQVVSSLLNLQSERIDDSHMRHMFRESINRIHSMAAIHELLYRSDTLTRIPSGDYISNVCDNLKSAFSATAGGVEIRIETEELFLELDTAIPCGLIINELVTNALKYAFPNGAAGVIDVSMGKNADGVYALRVADNGCGIPSALDWRSTDTLGLKIVRLLTEHQLNGSIELNLDVGAEFIITFKG